MDKTSEKLTTIMLTEEEANLFLKFQEHYQMVAYIVGILESMQIKKFSTCQLVLDFNPAGAVTHAQVTKHFRDLCLTTP